MLYGRGVNHTPEFDVPDEEQRRWSYPHLVDH